MGSYTPIPCLSRKLAHAKAFMRAIKTIGQCRSCQYPPGTHTFRYPVQVERQREQSGGVVPFVIPETVPSDILGEQSADSIEDDINNQCEIIKRGTGIGSESTSTTSTINKRLECQHTRIDYLTTNVPALNSIAKDEDLRAENIRLKLIIEDRPSADGVRDEDQRAENLRHKLIFKDDPSADGVRRRSSSEIELSSANDTKGKAFKNNLEHAKQGTKLGKSRPGNRAGLVCHG